MHLVLCVTDFIESLFQIRSHTTVHIYVQVQMWRCKGFIAGRDRDPARLVEARLQECGCLDLRGSSSKLLGTTEASCPAQGSSSSCCSCLSEVFSSETFNLQQRNPSNPERVLRCIPGLRFLRLSSGKSFHGKERRASEMRVALHIGSRMRPFDKQED